MKPGLTELLDTLEKFRGEKGDCEHDEAAYAAQPAEQRGAAGALCGAGERG